MQKTYAILVIALLGLTACDTGSDLDRAIVGGLIGCAAGEVYQDGECLSGAAIGAAGGALADDF